MYVNGFSWFSGYPWKIQKDQKKKIKSLTDHVHFSVCLVKPIICHCQVADQECLVLVVLIVLTHPDHSATSLKVFSKAWVTWRWGRGRMMVAPGASCKELRSTLHLDDLDLRCVGMKAQVQKGGIIVCWHRRMCYARYRRKIISHIS